MKKSLLILMMLAAILPVAATGLSSAYTMPALKESISTPLEFSDATISDENHPSTLLSREIDIPTWDFNYYGTIDESSEINALGMGAMATVRVAIAIPGDVVKSLKGNVIPLVYYLLGSNRFKNFTPFIALGDEELLGEPSVKTTMTFVQGDWTNWELETPYIIPATDGETPLYLGYEIKMSNNDYPIAFNTSVEAPDNALILVNKNEISPLGSKYGAAMIGSLIMGENLPINKVDYVSCTTEDITFLNEDLVVSAQVMNMGINDINSVLLTYSFDGGEETSLLQVLDEPIPSLSSAEIDYVLPAFQINGYYLLQTSITAVNDESCSSTTHEDIIKAISSEKGAAPHLLLEELTGTWCGYCPLGIVGIESAKKVFGDEIIPVAIHYNDEFEYPQYVNDFGTDYGFNYSFPSAYFNRMGVISPTEEILKTLWGIYRQYNAFASISTSAVIDGDVIHASAQTKFAFDPEEVNQNLLNTEYRVAFVLLENGITSIQANYIPQLPSLELEGWNNYDYLINNTPYNNFVFNDIALGIYDFSGLEESAMKGLKDSNYDYDITIPATVTDNSKLQVVAMLIDTFSGNIENAAVCDVAQSSAIESLSAESDVTVKGECGRIIINGDCRAASVFDTTGRMVSAGNSNSTSINSGIYLVRTVDANGRVAINKVVVR